MDGREYWDEQERGRHECGIKKRKREWENDIKKKTDFGNEGKVMHRRQEGRGG